MNLWTPSYLSVYTSLGMSIFVVQRSPLGLLLLLASRLSHSARLLTLNLSPPISCSDRVTGAVRTAEDLLAWSAARSDLGVQGAAVPGQSDHLQGDVHALLSESVPRGIFAHHQLLLRAVPLRYGHIRRWKLVFVVQRQEEGAVRLTT
jgi:hypothetical protein